MTTLAHFDTPISEPINAQIMQLVVDHLSDISAMEIAPSNLLYSIYQYAIGFEVHLYLQALDGSKGIAVELIVATDEKTRRRSPASSCTCRTKTTRRPAAWPTWPNWPAIATWA